MTLFDDNIAATLARTTDPDTSKESAALVADSIPDKQAYCVECIRKSPDSTQGELDKLYSPPDRPRMVGRRCNEVVADGRAIVSGKRKCTVSGRRGQTYRAVEDAK